MMIVSRPFMLLFIMGSVLGADFNEPKSEMYSVFKNRTGSFHDKFVFSCPLTVCCTVTEPLL